MLHVEPINLPFETCRICLTPEAQKAFAFHRFDLYQCQHCTDLFTDLKTEPEPYDEAYYFETYKAHFQRADMGLLRHIERMLAQHFTNQSDKRLLDIGTAVGLHPRHFNALGYECYGIDSSEAAIRYGTEQLGTPRLQAVALEDFRAEKPFPIIINNHVIEHVPDPVAFLEKIRSLVAEDGLLICSTVDSGSLIFSLAKLFYRATGGMVYQPLERICEVHHLHHFTQASLTYALERAGFEVIDRFHMNIPLYKLSLTPLQRLVIAGLYGVSELLGSYFVQGVVCRPSSKNQSGSAAASTDEKAPGSARHWG